MNTEDMFKSLKKYSSEKPYLNTEMGQYTFQLGFEEGDKCATKSIIDKVCEWLDMNLNDYISKGAREGISREKREKLFKDLRKDMKV